MISVWHSFSTWHYTTWHCSSSLNLRKSVFSWFSETIASWFSCYCFDCSSALSWPLAYLGQERQSPWFLFSLVPWHSIFCSLPMSSCLFWYFPTLLFEPRLLFWVWDPTFPNVHDIPLTQFVKKTFISQNQWPSPALANVQPNFQATSLEVQNKSRQTLTHGETT